MVRLTLVAITLFVISLMFMGVSYAKIDPETLVGMWRFDEGKGKVAADSSDKGNDGELVGNPNWVDGYLGEALEFSGGSDHVKVPNNPSLHGDEITFAAWIKPYKLESSYNMIATRWFNPEEYDYHFGIKDSGGGVWKMNLFLGVAQGPKDVFDVYADSEIFAGEWSHVAFTVNGDGDLTFYLNGEHDGERLGTTGRTMPFATSTLQISDHRDMNLGQFGLIDEVFLFNVAISEDDIKTLTLHFFIQDEGWL